ncbi:MAG: nucleotidyltransferase family protein, partial [Anaerolineae bacterium]|nr:nucleotidyltransferase family protein [Anaerolineae bacterium]
PVREVWGRVAAVVLAAGQGRRFGALKQLLPWHGVPLVAHVADQALACADVDRVFVTIGAGADDVRRGLAGRAVTCVPVPDWAAGQSRSVQAGLRAAQAASAVLFLLADQPGVSPALLSALIQRHRETLAPVVAPRYRGQRGNPVLFDRAVFAEFAALTGDIGARPLIQAHMHEIAWVDWPTPEILQDIDVAEDYRP